MYANIVILARMEIPRDTLVWFGARDYTFRQAEIAGTTTTHGGTCPASRDTAAIASGFTLLQPKEEPTDSVSSFRARRASGETRFVRGVSMR